MATFSDYYRQKMAAAPPPGQRPSSLPTYDFSGLSGFSKKIEEERPYGPIETVIDILSRPLYGVTNAVTGVSEGIADARQGNSLAAAGGVAAIPTNFLSSFFGTSGEEGKRTFSDVMEEQTDVHGKINNPNYEDTENNVDPVLKGTLGFVGDVALDPLTWIPGAVFGKAGNLLARGGKAAAEKVDDVAQAARGTEKAAEEAAPVKAVDEDGNPMPTLPDEMTQESLSAAQRQVRKRTEPEIDLTPGAVEAWAKTSNIPEVRTAWADYNGKLAKASASLSGDVPVSLGGKAVADAEKKLTELYRRHKVAEMPVKVTPQADRTWTEMFKTATAGPGAAAVRGELDEIMKRVGGSAPVEPKPFKEWFQESSKLNLFDDTVRPSEELANVLTSQSPAFGKYAAGSVGRLMAVAQSPAFSRLPQTLREEAKGLIQRFYQASQNETGTAVTDALSAFNLRRARNEDGMRAALGKKLFDYLERKADSSKVTAASFQKAIEELARVADPSIDMGVISRLGKEGGQFGAPTNALNAYTDTLGLPRYVRPEANSAEEVAAARDAVASMQRPSDEALLKTFREETSAGGKVMEQKYPVKHSRTRATDSDREVATRRYVRQLNTFFQYTLGKNLNKVLIHRIEQRVGKSSKEIAGVLRSSEWRNATYEAWDAAMSSLSALGIKMHIGHGSQEFVTLSYPDILRVTEEAMANPGLAQAALFNGGTQMAPTRLMEAVHYLVTSGARGDQALDDVTKILSNKKLTGYRGQVLDKDIPNNGLKSGPYAHFTGKSAEASARKYALETGGQAVENADKGWHVLAPKGGFAPAVAKALVEGADAFAARAAENAAAYAARGVSESKALTNSQIAKVAAILNDLSMEEAVEALAKIRARVADDGREIGAFPSSVDAAEAAVRATVGTFNETRARYFRQMSNAIEETPKKRKAIVAEGTTKQADVAGREADDLLSFDEVVPVDETAESAGAVVKAAEPDVPVYDIAGMDPQYGLRELAAQQGYVHTALHGVKYAFDQSYGMRNIFGIHHAKRTVAGQFMSKTVDSLRSLKKYTPEQLTLAMTAVKTGVPNKNPEIAGAVDEIQRIIGQVFDTSPRATSILNSPLLRTEPNIDHINAILRQKAGKDTSFQLEDLDDIAEMAGQWRNWDIKDPITDLFKITDAFVTAAEHRSIVGNFLYEMGKVGLVSKTYKPGMVRIGDSGGSTFAALIPEGTFVTKEVAAELHVLDATVRTDRKFQAGLGDFIQNSFIPAQNIWKQLVTVFRPGHHVRNHLGNNFMSWVARGNSYWLSSYKDAFRVLGAKNNYDGADLVESLTAIGERIPKADEVIVSGRHSFSSDEIYKLAQDNGLFSSYATTEDLMLDVAQGRLGRVGADLSNSRVGRIAGSASHFVDHQGKLQHFIQILKQESSGRSARWGKVSKAELVKRAVREVKRAHPDSLMLTPTESKWRFLIPFYTWFAKTLPFAMESAARNPGRLMAIPKASYNLAVAMGVNPNNLADPFPEDQLFPSFVTDGAFGPQFEVDGKYININPGAPQFDMLDQLFSPNPVEGILGMTSPLLRVPMELSTGSKIGGIPIRDTSDYLDQNLPIVNYLANITGQSVTGSAASLLQGQGLDPQAQVARGNKDGFDQSLSGLNWLFGLNAQNWSRPNFVNYAEIEKRNRAAESGGQ